jgi:hypothetical protein
MIGALTMLVLEKQKLFQLKAMGADHHYIQRIFLNEGFVLAAVGGGTGILIAIIICLLQIRFKLVKLSGGSFISIIISVKWFPADFTGDHNNPAYFPFGCLDTFPKGQPSAILFKKLTCLLTSRKIRGFNRFPLNLS